VGQRESRAGPIRGSLAQLRGERLTRLSFSPDTLVAMGKADRLRQDRRQQSISSRHHLVPQFYLRRFADEHGRLAAIRRGTGASHVASIEKVAAEVGFYTYVDLEGEESGAIEEMFGQFESHFAPAIDRVLADPKAMPAAEDHALILSFISFQVGRGRWHRQQYNALVDFGMKLTLEMESRDPEDARARLREVMGREPDEGDLAAWLEMLERPDDFEFEPHPNESLKVALDVSSKLFEEALAPRHWVITRFKEPELITSDEPVARWNRPRPEDAFVGRGLGNSDEVRLPLDRHHVLTLALEEPPANLNYLGVGEPFTTDQIRLTAASAHEWVFAHPQHPRLKEIAQWAREAPLRRVEVNKFGERVTITPGK
jgi:hypothetical protein